MSKVLSEKLNAAFGNTEQFRIMVDSHWPEIDRALCEVERLRAALVEISKDAPTVEPARENTGNVDDAADYGGDMQAFWAATIARRALFGG